MQQDPISNLHNQELYDTGDHDLMAEQRQALRLNQLFNQTSVLDVEAKQALLQEAFRSFGEGSYIETPYHANWGGRFVSVGKNVYINFNLTMVDDTYITIEDHVMIGPNVTLITGNHPLDASQRKQALQYNEPITIKQNAWIGAGAIIMPGVTIGENTVIGAGSIVTKDMPDNVLAYGSPCRVIRAIDQSI